ncbi:MAG: DUF1501 domain-containing protein, partial [Myxococcota bacterium]
TDPNLPSTGHYKVLEILQLGGVSHRETNWIEQPDAAPVWRQLSAVNWAQITPSPPNATATYPVVTGVNLGPACEPLHDAAIRDRIRMIAVAHRLPPHDPARAYVLGGRTLGRSQYFGLGAAVQRKRGVVGGLPAAWILDTGQPLIASYAAATGLHLGQSRPIVLPITDLDSGFVTRLDRSMRDDADALLAWYDCRYADGLTFPSGDPARSAGYAGYTTARAALEQWPQLHQHLVGAPPLHVGVPQAQFTASRNRTQQAIVVATWLLANGADYVCVIDNGAPKNGINVDSHATLTMAEHAQIHTTNMWSACQAVRSQVTATAGARLNLDQTMVLLHSEFGRYHDAGTGTGSDHWHLGYPMTLIGGPIRQSGVRGTLAFGSDPRGLASGGWSGAAHDPVDVRAAVAMAAGIAPFSPDMYSLSDTTGASQPLSSFEHDLLGL